MKVFSQMWKSLAVLAIGLFLAVAPAYAQDCTPIAPSPVTTGDNLLANPDLEVWASASTAADWIFGQSGGATLTRVSDANSGFYAAKISEGVYSGVTLAQDAPTGYFGRFSLWAKGSAKFAVIMGATAATFSTTDAWQQFTAERHVVNFSPYRVGIITQDAGRVLYLDNASLYRLYTPSLLSTCLYSSAVFSEQVDVMLSPGSMAGLVQYADVSNFVAVVVQPVGSKYQIHVAKFVAGVSSAVIPALAISYVPGAPLKLTRTAARVYTVFYNGLALGSVSIPDAVFDTANGGGLFSTNTENDLANYQWSRQ